MPIDFRQRVRVSSASCCVALHSIRIPLHWWPIAALNFTHSKGFPISSYLICGTEIPAIFRSQLIFTLKILFSSSFLLVQHSDPYKKLGYNIIVPYLCNGPNQSSRFVYKLLENVRLSNIQSPWPRHCILLLKNTRVLPLTVAWRQATVKLNDAAYY